MARLSVVIVAQDEERTIADVLKSVRGIAAEIIFVDSGSKDATIDIAKSFDVKLIHQDWLGYAGQKNFAIDQASGDWLLCVDADEIITPPLAAEITDTISGERREDGFRMPRLLYIGDRPVKHGGFYPDAQLRLFRRGRGRFNDRAVHEAVRVDGSVGMLKNDMLHYAYKDVDQFRDALDKYAHLSVTEAQVHGFKRWRLNPLNELFHPWWTLFYRHVFRLGFLEGALGWELNLLYSDYVRKKISYLRQDAEKRTTHGVTPTLGSPKE